MIFEILFFASVACSSCLSDSMDFAKTGGPMDFLGCWLAFARGFLLKCKEFKKSSGLNLKIQWAQRTPADAPANTFGPLPSTSAKLSGIQRGPTERWRARRARTCWRSVGKERESTLCWTIVGTLSRMPACERTRTSGHAWIPGIYQS